MINNGSLSYDHDRDGKNPGDTDIKNILNYVHAFDYYSMGDDKTNHIIANYLFD